MRFASVLSLSLLAPLIFTGICPVQASSYNSQDIYDSFELNPETYYYQYREPNLDKLEGLAFGINGAYTYSWSKFFLKADVTFDFGNLQYSSNGTGSLNSESDFTQDYRGLFGRQFTLSRNISLSPYTGLGFRVLDDSGNQLVTSTGFEGYDRESEYLYLPLGATFRFKADDWAILPTGEFDYLIRGWQSSSLTQVGFDQDITNIQKHGYGLRGSLLFQPPTDFFHFSIGPFIRYWSIRGSDEQLLTVGGAFAGYGTEPPNTTLETGIAAHFRF